MREGIAASGTCRRFSRPALMSAVSSGGSSVTRSTFRSPPTSPMIRTGRGLPDEVGVVGSNVARTSRPF